MRSKKMLKSPERLWPRAAVIYKFDATLRCPESYKCTIIMDAMDHIMEKTCVRFKEWSGERDFVRIEETASASGTSLYATSDSSLGKVRGEQTIRIHPKAWFNNGQGTVLHEMGHTLGLIDEHNHPDRDHYLKILSDNIHPGALINFQKRDRAVTNILGQPLDFDSVMMYPDYSFSKEPGILKALRSKVGLRYHYKTSLSSRLSAGDVRRIQDLYRCDGSNQKPSFPVDVVCSFDDDSCGFKGLGKNPHWEWIPNTVKFEDGWKGANQQAKGAFSHV
nr:PREDICTED: astacin-like metalloprotease toxin 5 [Bemisia tabaci]